MTCGISSLSSKYHNDEEKLLAQKMERVARGSVGWECGTGEKNTPHGKVPPLYTHVRTSFNFFWAALGASSSEFFPLERARAAFFSF